MAESRRQASGGGALPAIPAARGDQGGRGAGLGGGAARRRPRGRVKSPNGTVAKIIKKLNDESFR